MLRAVEHLQSSRDRGDGESAESGFYENKEHNQVAGPDIDTESRAEQSILVSLLPWGKVVPWGTEMRMKRERMRKQLSLAEKKVLAQGILLALPWVCPNCSPGPADSMLQSGTLFTF